MDGKHRGEVVVLAVLQLPDERDLDVESDTQRDGPVVPDRLRAIATTSRVRNAWGRAPC